MLDDDAGQDRRSYVPEANAVGNDEIARLGGTAVDSERCANAGVQDVRAVGSQLGQHVIVAPAALKLVGVRKPGASETCVNVKGELVALQLVAVMLTLPTVASSGACTLSCVGERYQT